jgi:hypothetical protein
LSSDLQDPAADKKPKKDEKDGADEAAQAAKPVVQEKKPKKKKVANESEPSPDEPVDPEADAAGRGLKFSWKQHPSMRIGDVFRIDLEAKLQEDGHSSYGPVKGLNTWEFHRNRFGVQGYLTKHIEYEVEHEFTEKELTEKDILVGITPSSWWKDVYINLTYVKNAQVQIGKFKVPFGLDELTGVTHNDFVYRSLGAVYLTPARDIGAGRSAASGSVLTAHVVWRCRGRTAAAARGLFQDASARMWTRAAATDLRGWDRSRCRADTPGISSPGGSPRSRSAATRGWSPSLGSAGVSCRT